MKILLINKFLYKKGGAEIATINTGKLLAKKGHEVFYWGMDHSCNPNYKNSDLFISNVDFNKKNNNFLIKTKMAMNIIYSFEAKRKLSKLIEMIKPDIIHLHNIAHQISPSILSVCKKKKIPIIMTLHDYKLVCPAYTLLAKNRLCEKCRFGRYYWCLINKCTKESYIKSAINMLEMYLHNVILKSYNLIDVFISPSLFLKNKLENMGFNKEIKYIPNFINSNNNNPNGSYNENSIIYFGRLSHEKGLSTLIDSVRGIDVTLKIAGEGLQKSMLQKIAQRKSITNIKFLGYRKGKDLIKEILNSKFVVVPSEWYENNPLSIIESFSLGKPVVASRIGGIPELVKDGYTGYLFNPGDSRDLSKKIKYLLLHENMIISLGNNAKSFVEENFNEELYYKKIIEVYDLIIKRKKKN